MVSLLTPWTKCWPSQVPTMVMKENLRSTDLVRSQAVLDKILTPHPQKDYALNAKFHLRLEIRNQYSFPKVSKSFSRKQVLSIHSTSCLKLQLNAHNIREAHLCCRHALAPVCTTKKACTLCIRSSCKAAAPRSIKAIASSTLHLRVLFLKELRLDHRFLC